ncbi:potassium channel family protein [Micromonospora psammae]|uniref:potassium channel family protein n=1 Tax=Micromonospora sp. CPCC 205556 TaxID=3122398 RepID=UPI002FEEF711
MPHGYPGPDISRLRPTRRARIHYALLRHHTAWLFSFFVLAYSVIASLFGVVYQILSYLGHGQVQNTQSFWDRLYFSFITQLSMEYSSLDPTAWSRPVAVVQALVGTVLFGVLTAYVVLRVTSPDPKTLVLSPVAVYIKSEKVLAILLVNTCGITVTDLAISMVLKLRRRHTRLQTTTLPYLRTSALLVKGLGYDPVTDDIGSGYDPSEDGLKVAVRCSILGAGFGVDGKYNLTKVVVAENDDFMDRPEFQEPDLGSKEFWELFSSPVPDAQRLHDLMLARAREKPSGSDE